MNENRRRLVKEIFFAASEEPPDKQEALIRSLADNDQEVIDEVMSLLAHDDGNIDDAFADNKIRRHRDAIAGAVDSGLATVSAMESEWEHGAIPESIGKYRIERLIGEGGMGLVYQARQEHPDRVVALKVIRPQMASGTLLRRFKHEAEVLGQLQHPGIAHIYEAGVAVPTTGENRKPAQPFFAMELIAGQSITSHARDTGLDIPGILELVARVCDALQHAHNKGVIHRDLKPANIIVDHTGQPKILDFGVARLTDTDAPAVTTHTEMGSLVGTVPYMSPEQIKGDSRLLDTRADVYAIGVLTFELLAGILPYVLQDKTVLEAARVITDTEPIRLGSVRPACRGDIETIVAKTLDKDRDRRYQTAAGLALDLRRFLSHEPITAHPPSAVYQLKKFARRNKGMVSAVLALILALSAGVVASTAFALRARKAEADLADQVVAAREAQALAEDRQQEAERQARMTLAVNDFLNEDLLASVDPSRTDDRDITVKEALDTAAEKIPTAFPDQPLVEAAIRLTLGRTYRGLGLYPQSKEHLNIALARREELRGSRHEETIDTMLELARTLTWTDENAEAEALFLQAEKAVEESGHDDRRHLLAIGNDLGMVYIAMGRYDDAIARLNAAYEGRKELLGEEDDGTLASLNNLAVATYYKGDYESAVKYQRIAYEQQRQSLGPKHPGTLNSMTNIAYLYDVLNRYEESEEWYENALELHLDALGERHHLTLNAMRNLALLYDSMRRYDDAIELQSRALGLHREVLGEQHAHTIVSMGNLAQAYGGAGQFDKSKELFTAVIDLQIESSGEESTGTTTAMNNFALVLQKAEEYEEAQKWQEKCLAIQQRTLGPEHRYTIISMNNLGRTMLFRDQPEQAESHLSRTLDIAQKALPPDDDLICKIKVRLGAAKRALNKRLDAEVLFTESYEQTLKNHGPDHPLTKRVKEMQDPAYNKIP
ncbi:MAG: tetratricopeptide repeat protein [Planctomycetota bacterium]